MSDPFDAWGTHTLEPEGSLECTLGPLTVRVRERAGEVQLSHSREGDEAAEPVWARHAPHRWNREVTLRPAFPDRPLVVDPEDSFHLLDGAEIRIYVLVPLWVQVEIEGRTGVSTLARIPTEPASDTWFGTPLEGELCYWLATSARRTLEGVDVHPHEAVCPVALLNRSGADLDVRKIALRVSYLSVYTDEGRLWSDETRVRYQGESEESRLDVAGAPPEEVPHAQRLAPPRQRMVKGFRARTFARLRTFHPWG